MPPFVYLLESVTFICVVIWVHVMFLNPVSSNVLLFDVGRTSAHRYLNRKWASLQRWYRGVCASVWVMHIWSVRNKANSALCFSVCSGSWKNKTFKAYNFDALGVPPATGHLHPLLKVRTEIRQIFLEMGWVSLFGSMLSFLVSTVPRVFHWVRFTEMPTNNFIESSFWNFDALFQPQQHPARDAHDTFFLKGVCVCVCCSLVHSYKPCFLLVTAHPTCTDHTHYCCYVTGLTWCTLLHVQILSYHMTFHRTIWNE